MVGEMRVSSNNGLKKDWKTVIVVKWRQRQCKEGWGSLSRANKPCFGGNFLVVLKHFNEFSMSFCFNTRGRNTLVQMSIHWPWQDKDVWMSEQWTGLGLIPSTMKGGHALGTVNQSSEQVFADWSSCSRQVGHSGKRVYWERVEKPFK